MKSRHLFLTLIIALAGACDRRPQAEKSATESTRDHDRSAVDERRLAELRDLERRTAERETAARAAETDLERKRIEDERAALGREKQRLIAAQHREDEQKREADKANAAEAARQAGQQARAEQTLDFFYDPLDPYGDWIELERHGYCWRPAAGRDPRWRPYTDGHWAWTDYGWTWASNEPFGWAAYHYGRWTRVKRLGWVWVPGSEWAPAWVAWRRSDSFVGWAPLPPDAHSGSGFTAAVDSYYDIGPGSYAFVAVESFGEPTYVGRVVEPTENVTIINKTVNVTNITYRTVQNKTVVHNAGPEINIINQRSKQPVRTMRVERDSEARPDGRAESQGNVLRLVAPHLKSAVKGGPAPAKIKERARAEEIDRGWGETQSPAVEKIRAQQVQEARKAEAAQRSPQPAVSAETTAPQPSPGETPKPQPKPGGQPVDPPAKPAPPANAPTGEEVEKKKKEAEEKARKKPAAAAAEPRAEERRDVPARKTPQGETRKDPAAESGADNRNLPRPARGQRDPSTPREKRNNSEPPRDTPPNPTAPSATPPADSAVPPTPSVPVTPSPPAATEAAKIRPATTPPPKKTVTDVSRARTPVTTEPTPAGETAEEAATRRALQKERQKTEKKKRTEASEN